MSNAPQPLGPGQFRAPLRPSAYGGRTRQEVANFIEGRSPEEVQALIDSGTLGPTGEEYARQWIESHRARLQDADRAEELALYRRSVKAAEESAASARHAVVWARWAVVVALAALFVAAWEHFRFLA